MTVRQASPHDWERWRELRLRALADAPDAFGETLAEARAQGDVHWRSHVAPRRDAVRLLAERDAAAVGMAVVAIDPDDRRCAQVFAMWVAPEARGLGIAAALVQHGLAWARERAALAVELRVGERQQAARRLYLRLGFCPTGDHGPLRDGSDLACERLAIRLAPLIMGVVNVTPDSFSDGGDYLAPAAAIGHGRELVAAGADILDVGGEATNPQAQPVPASEELRRILPVIAGLVGAGARISVDTTKAEVARAAVLAGASIVNDVAGGLFDPGMVGAVCELAADGRDLTYIAGHLRGGALGEVFTAEGGVAWRDVASELAERVVAFRGVHVWVDPGIGFGKGADPEGNVALLRHAGDIGEITRRPVVVGASRKRFLRRLLAPRGQAGPAPDLTRDELDAASTLASLAAARAGAHVLRVHNVTLLRAALTAYNRE
jgi:dihydropteroate synthase